MNPAERHRAMADGFTARVDGVDDWTVPAPVTVPAPLDMSMAVTVSILTRSRAAAKVVARCCQY